MHRNCSGGKDLLYACRCPLQSLCRGEHIPYTRWRNRESMSVTAVTRHGVNWRCSSRTIAVAGTTMILRPSLKEGLRLCRLKCSRRQNAPSDNRVIGGRSIASSDHRMPSVAECKCRNVGRFQAAPLSGTPVAAATLSKLARQVLCQRFPSIPAST
jgi:hypothetical protein